MEPHYFGQDQADTQDLLLSLAKRQGYVSENCLLGGIIVMGLISTGENPCSGCNGPRERCGGQPKRGV